MTLRLLIGYEGTEAGREAMAYIAPLLADPTVEATLLTVTHHGNPNESLYDEAVRVLGATPVEHIAMAGSMYSALLQTAQAQMPDLVVFGEVGRTWGRWTRYQRRKPLSAALPVSSLLVRGGATGISRALICAGGDDSVIADAHLTARLARRTGAHATILHVLSQVPLVFRPGASREHIVESFAATGAPEMKFMQTAVDELVAAGVYAGIKLRFGLVVEEIVNELAEGGYDLLVVGAHRSEGLVQRLLLEDVTANILGKSPGPILVVKQVEASVAVDAAPLKT